MQLLIHAGLKLNHVSKIGHKRTFYQHGIALDCGMDKQSHFLTFSGMWLFDHAPTSTVVTFNDLPRTTTLCNMYICYPIVDPCESNKSNPIRMFGENAIYFSIQINFQQVPSLSLLEIYCGLPKWWSKQQRQYEKKHSRHILSHVPLE